MTKEEFLQTVKPRDVIVLQGVPGSGKSTMAQGIKDRFPSYTQIFSADHGMVFQGLYTFQPWKLGKCHKDCFRSFLDVLDDTELVGNNSILIVDNTNTTNIEIAPYIAAASAYNRECYLVTINIPLETAIKRQVHGVPASKISTMAKRIENSIKTMPSYWKHFEVEGE